MLTKVNPLDMPTPIMQYAEGGSLLSPEMPMEDEEMMEETPTQDNLAAFMDILDEEEGMQLMEAIEMHPVVQKVVDMASFSGDGMVDGEGGPTEDKVAARLSPGEFVFPVGLVEEIGRDKLQALLDEYNNSKASES